MSSKLLLRRKRTNRRAPASRQALSADWQQWAADNLLRGVPVESLLTTLAGHGVPPSLGAPALAALAASPLLDLARAERRRAGRIELLATLRRALDATATDPGAIDRRADLGGEELFERYYRTGTPVVITDLVPRWPAFERWTPAYLKDRFGAALVQVMQGRDADPLCDRNLSAHARASTLADFVDRVTAATADTNDFYMVANNRALEDPALAPLLDDLSLPPDYLASPIVPGTACLWFGPAGTVTPLHHDTSNILFCQVHGRKRVRLISPFETSLIDDLDGFYSPIDAEAPDLDKHPSFRDVRVSEVLLAPGEALFLPVGWYHHVRALDASISISFTGFVRSNRFEWYAPGNSSTE